MAALCERAGPARGSKRRPAVAVLSVFLLTSCGYFDLQHPPEPTPDPPALPDTTVTWEKHLGGAGEDAGLSVQVALDGGYIIAGYLERQPVGTGNLDLWLIKTDKQGNELWSATFGGLGREAGTCVRRTSDGGYIVAGYTDSSGAGGLDAWLIKTDEAGNREWSHTYGGVEDDRAGSVEQTSDGGYILAVQTQSYGPTPLWLLKVDETGGEQWSSLFGPTPTSYGFCAVQSGDGGYVVAGVTEADPTWEDAYVLRTDDHGAEQWSVRFGRDYPDRVVCVDRAADGGFVVAGTTRSWGEGDFNGWLIRIDGSGRDLWARTYGGDFMDSIECVRQAADGGFLLAGTTHGRGGEDAWLVKTDSAGNGGGVSSSGDSGWTGADGSKRPPTGATY